MAQAETPNQDLIATVRNKMAKNIFAFTKSKQHVFTNFCLLSICLV